MRRANAYINRGSNEGRSSRHKAKTVFIKRESLQVPSGLAKMMPLIPEGYGSSDSARVAGAAKFFSDAEVNESVETHLIPRKSLTAQLFLGLITPVIETEDRKTRQLDKMAFKAGITHLAETTDKKITFKSDKTLLRRGNPFAMPTDVKRSTSKTKQIRIDPDTEFRTPKALKEQEVFDADLHKIL